MKIFFYTLIIAFMIISTRPASAVNADDIPRSAGVVLNLAGQLAGEEKVDEAIKVLEKFRNKKEMVNIKIAEQKGYTHFYIDFMLGNYHLMDKQPDRAAWYYQSAVQKKKDLASGWLNLAKCRYDLNQMRPAGEAFLTGYQVSKPQKSKHLYYSAICYLASEDYETAGSLFKQLFINHNRDIKLEWKEGFIQTLFALENYAQALPYIEALAAETTGKKQKNWQEVLLHQYISLKMNLRSTAYAKWLTLTDTFEPKWWKALAHVHLQQEQYPEGLTALLISGFLSPPSPKELKLIADLYLMLEIPGEAVKYYEGLLKTEMEVDTIKKTVWGYRRLYAVKTALAWVEEGFMHDPQEDLLWMKADILFELNRFSEAATLFEKLSTTKQNPGKALLMIGYASWNTGELIIAKKAFEKALAYKAQKKYAQKALQQLDSFQIN